MGDWTALVLTHASGLPEPLADHADDLEAEVSLRMGWRLLRFGDTELAGHPNPLLCSLEAATGQAALAALVADSDELVLFGRGAVGLWRAVLPPSDDHDPTSAQDLEPGTPRELTGDAAAAAIVSWAATAGLTVETDQITRLCRDSDDHSFAACAALDMLLAVLGLTGGD